jgi:hypothetical protein
MDWEQTGLTANDPASVQDVERLLSLASRDDLAECLRGVVEDGGAMPLH